MTWADGSGFDFLSSYGFSPEDLTGADTHMLHVQDRFTVRWSGQSASSSLSGWTRDEISYVKIKEGLMAQTNVSHHSLSPSKRRESKSDRQTVSRSFQRDGFIV